MSKKELQNNAKTDLVPLEDAVKGKTPAVEDKTTKKPVKAKKARKSLGKKIKEIFSELKKVSWPTFPKILKQTGIVIAVVLFFLVVIGLADVVLSFLLNLLV